MPQHTAFASARNLPDSYYGRIDGRAPHPDETYVAKHCRLCEAELLQSHGGYIYGSAEPDVSDASVCESCRSEDEHDIGPEPEDEVA